MDRRGRPSGGRWRRWRRAGCVSVGLLALGAGCGEDPATMTEPEPAGPCTSADARCSERVLVEPGVYVPVFTTYSLATGSEAPELAVVVVHGTNRNADDYFASMVAAAGDAQALPGTLIVSPRFQTSSDGPAFDEARWTSGGWKRGHLSLESGPAPRVSSYAALDRIVEIVTNRSLFPSVNRVVVTGHSAGGQVVHRYAATSPMDAENVGVPVRYVPANPSTWLYVGPERWDGTGWSVPTGGDCPDYDDWHYGMEDRNTYASRLSADSIRSLLAGRDVVVLAGDADTLAGNLDVSCGANLQGAHRYERALRLSTFLEAHFPANEHRLAVVPGVGHSNVQMFTSGTGLGAIFLP